MTDYKIGNNLYFGGMQQYLNSWQSAPYTSYMPYQNDSVFNSAYSSSFTPSFTSNSWLGMQYGSPQYNCGTYNPMFTFGSSSSSSSSNNKYMTVEECRRQQSESYKNTFKARRQEEIKNGPTDKEWEILSKEYAKGLAPSESFTGAVVGTAVVAPVFGAGKMKRAVSQGESGKEIKKIVETEEKAKALYGKMDGNKVAREVAEKIRILEDMSKREKATVFRSKCDPAIYDKSIKEAIEILKSGDYERLVLLNEQLSQVTVKNNWFARTWRSLRGESEPATEKLLEVFKPSTDKYKAACAAAEKTLGLTEGALEAGAKATGKITTKGVIKGVTKHAGGAGVMAGIEILMKIPDIQEAFSKDSATGWKQVGQTTVKAAGSAAGWIAGEAAFTAASTWAIAEICAATGTAIAPGLGTAIGFVVGMIGGAIGCWLAGKATNAMVGEDVANEVRAEKMLAAENNKTVKNPDGTVQPTGKEQLLQYAISMHGQGKASPEVERILKRYQLVA